MGFFLQICNIFYIRLQSNLK